MHPFKDVSPTRQATINALAVIGFITLVAGGMWLAVYSTRFVPGVVNGVGAAAVYLGSLFTPSAEPPLSVVPPATSTFISFGPASTTPTEEESTPTEALPTTPVTQPGTRTTSVTQIGGTAPIAPHGLPDLQIIVTAIGYLTSSSANTFVASATVPDGKRPAVKFTVKNIGTNIAAPWRFEATLPTRGTLDYDSPLQQALNPGDSIDYTLGFDRARSGENQPLKIIVDSSKAVVESNENNNTISLGITVLD